jgi:hypothetical protein
MKNNFALKRATVYCALTAIAVALILGICLLTLAGCSEKFEYGLVLARGEQGSVEIDSVDDGLGLKNLGLKGGYYIQVAECTADGTPIKDANGEVRTAWYWASKDYYEAFSFAEVGAVVKLTAPWKAY